MTESERAYQIASEICASAPTAILDAVDGDILKAAVLCAESYYRMKLLGEDSVKPAVDSNTYGANVLTMLFWLDKGCSVIFLAAMLDTTPGNVIYDLNQVLPFKLDTACMTTPISEYTYREIQNFYLTNDLSPLRKGSDSLLERDTAYNNMKMRGWSAVDIARHRFAITPLRNALPTILHEGYDVYGTDVQETCRLLIDWYEGKSVFYLATRYEHIATMIHNTLRKFGYIIPEVHYDFNLRMLSAALCKYLGEAVEVDDCFYREFCRSAGNRKIDANVRYFFDDNCHSCGPTVKDCIWKMKRNGLTVANISFAANIAEELVRDTLI